MTERKAFKRRVRAQMEVTGQSYAQAAAQLEAGNPARLPETHPASAVVVALLRASGLTLDPLTAFGVGGGIGFMYGLFRYGDVPHPLLTLVCQHHPEPWAPAILERLGVDHSAAAGRRELNRLLADERAAILPVAAPSPGSVSMRRPSGRSTSCSPSHRTTTYGSSTEPVRTRVSRGLLWWRGTHPRGASTR